MLISEKIARILEVMLNEQNGIIEIKRNEFANLVGCVPSQINYVITSRFNKDRGYIVESRRGGGGYIKIIRPEMTGSTYLCHLLGIIGNEIDSDSAVFLVKDMYSKGVISEREASIIISVLGNISVFEASKNALNSMRAEMLKSAVLTIMQLQ